jgi:hypothetical protein
MGFNDATEVRKYLGGVFEVAFADPEIGPKLKDTGIVLKTVYTEPDAVVIIDAANGTVSEGTAESEATAEMRMTAETGNAYWQGKVNLPLAMAKSKIKVDGNVASLLKLAPLGKKLYPKYVETLQADGRDDLIV